MRARNIKPGFFKNEALAEAGLVARLLFAGMWCMADRRGRLKDSAKLIKAEVFPFDDTVDSRLINGELTVIERLGFIRRYKQDGIAVIEVLNFSAHQNPHNTEKESTLPAFDEKTSIKSTPYDSPLSNGELTVDSPLDNGEYLADSLIPDSLIHRKEQHPPHPTDAPPPNDIEKNETEVIVLPKATSNAFKKQVAVAKPAEVDEQVWADWLALRKQKRAPVTQTVLNGAMTEAQKAGLPLEAFLRVWCLRGSQGLEAAWLKPAELQRARALSRQDVVAAGGRAIFGDGT